LSTLFDHNDIIVQVRNVFILIDANLCGRVEKACWSITGSCPTGWKPLVQGRVPNSTCTLYQGLLAMNTFQKQMCCLVNLLIKPSMLRIA